MNVDALKAKWRWTAKYTIRTISELFRDLAAHFFSTYPLLLILGAWRRLRRRLASIWLPRSPGRPPVDEVLVELILEMKRENPGWGGQRISDELKMIGFSVSKKAVLRVLRENGMIPPRTKFVAPSWRALHDSYRRIWGIDFMITFDVRGNQLYTFNIIDWVSRRLIVSSVTTNPTVDWIMQQFRNAAAETLDCFPDVVVRDNDQLFGTWLDDFLREDFDIETILIQSGCPWQNGRTERMNKSEKYEALIRIPIADEQHCGELTSLYRDYYNSERPHQALEGLTPSGNQKECRNIEPGKAFQILKKPAVNGLITTFELAAA